MKKYISILIIVLISCESSSDLGLSGDRGETSFSAGSDSNNTDLVLADSSDGGCNSRGGGPASVSLILLSLVPAYVLKRKRRNI